MAAGSSRPSLSVTDAARLVHRFYGLEAEATTLPSYSDQNFLIECTGGESYILKLARSTERHTVLELQDRALRRLACGPDAHLFSQLAETLDGESLTYIPSADGRQHGVRLMSALHGTLLGDVADPSERLLSRLGAAIGRMDRVLSGLHDPASHRMLVWDAVKAPTAIRQYLPAIRNEERRSLVTHLVDSYEERCASRLPSLRRSLIHNDCNEWNLLADGDEPSGIFDFGDMLHSLQVNEIAICMAYAMLGRDEPLRVGEALLQGYHSEFPLTADEVDVVFDLVRLRLCLSVAMSSRLRLQDPKNTYLSISAAPAWEMLERIVDQSCDEMASQFRSALDLGRAKTSRPYATAPDATAPDLSHRRRQVLGPSLSLSYRKPLKIVRGRGAFLYDDEGLDYLDLVNNVCHVGHCHPRVVTAAHQAMATLNTNTRYLHPAILDYAERILATLPTHLEVCYFVNSGSEATELALRMARTHTGRRDVLVIDHGYHGNTQGAIEVSPYKFHGKGGAGKPPATHIVPIADPYRGRWGRDDPDAGDKYAQAVDEIARDLRRQDRGLAALIAESISGCGGQVVYVDEFLREAFDRTRRAGGVTIADEVQVGFGRVGSHMWAFETQGALPDIVTMGKPAGNGHPLGLVATSRAIADSFANGMEYFNTFGGNPVSCAVGLAVLDVIRDEDLQRHALELGEHFLDGLRQLQSQHEIVGDLRGLGLFLGIELVRDRETQEPATAEASDVVNAMRERRILLSTDGPYENVIKIKPPMVLQRPDVDRVIEELDVVFHSVVAHLPIPMRH